MENRVDIRNFSKSSKNCEVCGKNNENVQLSQGFIGTHIPICKDCFTKLQERYDLGDPKLVRDIFEDKARLQELISSEGESSVTRSGKDQNGEGGYFPEDRIRGNIVPTTKTIGFLAGVGQIVAAFFGADAISIGRIVSGVLTIISILALCTILSAMADHLSITREIRDKLQGR